MGLLDEEAALSPHNVDTIRQASMILTLFLWIADYLENEDYLKIKKKNEEI